MSVLQTLSYIARGPFGGTLAAANDERAVANADSVYQQFQSKGPSFLNTGGYSDETSGDAEPPPALKSGVKVADAVRQHLDTLAGEEGDNPLGSPDAWKMKSGQQKVAAVNGLLQKQQMQSSQAQTQMMLERLKDYGAQAQEREANAAAGKTAGQILKTYGQLMQPDEDTGETMSPTEALNQALGQLPDDADVGRALPLAIRSIGQWNEAAAASSDPMKLIFHEDPTTGDRFATYGKQILNSGVNPAKVNGAALPIADENGNVLGHAVPNGKGGMMFQPIKADKGVVNAADAEKLIIEHQKARTQLLGQLEKVMASGSPPANVVDAINEELGQHQQAIAQLKSRNTAGGKAPNFAPPGASKPSPADIKYLQAHPEYEAHFNKRFGAKAADEYLP